MRGDVNPCCAREDDALQRLATNEVLQLQLEGRCYVLYPERRVQEVILEAIRRREHLTSGDLVVDVGQHVKHLVVVRHDGIRAQTTPDLSGQHLEIYS